MRVSSTAVFCLQVATLSRLAMHAQHRIVLNKNEVSGHSIYFLSLGIFPTLRPLASRYFK